MVELVDTLVLGTSAARREGSSPFLGTISMFVNSHQRLYFPQISAIIKAASFAVVRYVGAETG